MCVWFPYRYPNNVSPPCHHYFRLSSLGHSYYNSRLHYNWYVEIKIKCPTLSHILL